MSIPTLSLRTVTSVAIAAILAQPLAGCSGAIVLAPHDSRFAKLGSVRRARRR